MITITNGQLLSVDLESGLRILNNHRGFGIKTNYAIGKIISKIEKKIQEARNEKVKYLTSNCEKEEDGKFKIVNGQIVMKNAEEAEKHIAEYLKTTYEIDANKLNIEEIDQAKISAAELSALEPFIYCLEEVK